MCVWPTVRWVLFGLFLCVFCASGLRQAAFPEINENLLIPAHCHFNFILIHTKQTKGAAKRQLRGGRGNNINNCDDCLIALAAPQVAQIPLDCATSKAASNRIPFRLSRWFPDSPSIPFLVRAQILARWVCTFFGLRDARQENQQGKREEERIKRGGAAY